MGKTAGQNAAGVGEDFKKFTNSTIFNSLNAKVFSAGSVDFDDPLLDQVGMRNDVEGTYRKVFFRDGKLVAGILIGDTTKQIKVLKAIENGLDYESAKEAGLV
jgi:NAD(P)H-nitrite reductase large subunit